MKARRPFLAAALGAALLTTSAIAPALAQDAPADPYAELERRYREAQSAFFKRYRKARTDEERRRLRAEDYPRKAFEKAFLELAERERKRPAALKALAWVLSVGRAEDARRRALDRIVEDHAKDPALAEHLPLIAEAAGGEDTLRALIAASSTRAVLGRARYLLAQLLVRDRRALTIDREVEAAALLRKVIAEDAELPAGEVSLGARARGALFQINALRSGRPVPNIKGPGLDGSALDLRVLIAGRPALLLFWSGDDLDSGGLAKALAAIEKASPGKLAIVGVALDAPEDSREAAREAALRWPSFVDEDGAIAERWGVFSGPQALLIDGQGRVSGRLGGVNRLRQRVTRLLAD